MPTVIEIRLTASWTLQPDTRQLHGLACAVFETGNGNHLGQDKPFAVWPLRPAPGGQGNEWLLRASWLPAAPVPDGLTTAAQFRLGHVTCAIAEAVQRSVSHARLAATEPTASAHVRFLSPTYFAQNGSDVLIPDPRLVVGSWRRRWNASLPEDDPLAIGDGSWRELHPMIRLAEFQLRTERRDSERGPERVGFTGSATLRLTREASHAARARFGTLARFAEFCGTGAQTTHGFGATTLADRS